jgi:23S rRNA (adenine2030-N6)-methyltransferase
MLSYRHGFHAGNFADVLKHLLLVQVIDYLKTKPAPIRYIDTHSGAGLYELRNRMSQKTEEYRLGVGAIELSALPQSARAWGTLIGSYLAENRYPGSPLIAAELLRPQDELRLFEMHPAEYEQLATLFKRDRRVRIFHSDGYAAVKSQLPVQNARALVLIDPSYELDADYYRVAEAVKEGLRRMPNAVFAVWYPVVAPKLLQPMLRKLENLGEKRGLKIELHLENEEVLKGMRATGMLVINGPWTLADTMSDSLRVIAEQMSGKFTVASA